MTIIAATDRAGQVFTGTQHGLLTPTVIPALLRNHPRDPEDDESTESYDPAPSYALGFGGAGYNVVTGDATSNNFLFGGEGRSVLYGGSYDDCLSLGAGGGVARTYGGNNHVWNYGDGLIYAGPGYNLIMCYHGTSRIVLDPAGEHEIYGFGPAKDQISFMGAFPDAAALDAATRVENANLGFDDEVHTVIDLPGGGKVTFILASVREQIGAVCLDFTDGWYATGWTEPDDYDAALFDPSVTPYATKPAITTPADEADDNQHFPNA